MTIEELVMARLLGWADLTAVVAQRIYVDEAPQNAPPPYIILSLISKVREQGFGEPVGLVQSRFQFDLLSTTRTGCQNLGAKVRAALDRWRSPNTVPVIFDTLPEGENWGTIVYQSEQGDLNSLRTLQLDYLLHHSE